MTRIVVDLPAPFGPRNPVTRPRWAVKETLSTAVKPPYLRVSESTVIMGQPLRQGTGRRIGCHPPCSPTRPLPNPESRLTFSTAHSCRN